MRETVTPDTVANTAMMLRTAQPSKRPILLVEGRSDRRMLDHCLGKRVEVLPSAGKDNVFGAVRVLEENRKQTGWYFALLDADFDRILGVHRAHAAVAVTELHDLECEYLASPALEKVLREYASRDRLAHLYGGTPDALDWPAIADRVRRDIHGAGRHFGALRLVNARHRLGIDFKELHHHSVLKPKSLDVDMKKLIELVVLKNPGLGLDRKALLRATQEELTLGHDPWQLCRGHDLVALFALGMRRVWCSSAPSEQVLEASLRLGFEQAFFAATPHGALVVQFVAKHEAPLLPSSA